MAGSIFGTNSGASLSGALSPLMYAQQPTGFMQPGGAPMGPQTSVPQIDPAGYAALLQSMMQSSPLVMPPPQAPMNVARYTPPPVDTSGYTPGLNFDISAYNKPMGFLSLMRDHPEMLRYMSVQSG